MTNDEWRFTGSIRHSSFVIKMANDSRNEFRIPARRRLMSLVTCHRSV
jgi:hypothetical protein